MGVHDTLVEPCNEWPVRHVRTGYGRRKVNGRVRPAHRVEWEIHHGPIPQGMKILHRCDNPPCREITHLFMGTQADNMKDMTDKGRRRGGIPFGVNNPRAKLNPESVKAIRSEAASGIRRQVIADRYGIGLRCVSSIISRRTWKEIP